MGLHKLNSRWEGPFIVTKVTRPRSYRIIDADGNEVPNSRNIEHLRKSILDPNNMTMLVDVFKKARVFHQYISYIKGSFQSDNIISNYSPKGFSN